MVCIMLQLILQVTIADETEWMILCHLVNAKLCIHRSEKCNPLNSSVLNDESGVEDNISITEHVR